MSDPPTLETELDRARDLRVSDLADAIESIGFECTRCGACCKGHTADDGEREPHTATVFPDEVRRVADTAADDDTREGLTTLLQGVGAAQRSEPQPVGAVGLARSVRDPEVKHGLGYLLTVAKAIGRERGAAAEE